MEPTTLPIPPDGKVNGKSGATSSPAILDLVSDLTPPLKSAEDETKPNGKWELKKLNGRHREIMRQVLEGGSYVSIAANVGMSVQAVMLIANSAIFKDELSKLEAEADWNVIKRAEALSNESLSSLRDIMRHSQSETRRESSAKEILGIAGYSKIEKKLITSVSGEDVIRELNRRRRERAVNPEGDSRGEVSGSIELIPATNPKA